MEGGLRLTLLGKPQTSQDGTPPVGFIYNKALALLAYLAVTRRPHSRDALAGLLWGEMPDEYARANLRKILSVLREAVGSHLTISRQMVAFRQESEYWLDTEVFESKLLSLPSSALAPAGLSEKEIRLLDEAVKLYRGDFLEGFYVRDAPAFEEWVLPERERLRQMVLQALYKLAAHCTVRGEYAKGIDYTSRLLALEPWHEEVHQQMMLLLALSGQRSAAAEQFERCRRILAEEMGAQPNADTVSLYQKIKAGEVTSYTALSSTLHRSAGIFGLWPVQATAFVGRANEMAVLADRLATPECRLVTITGLSGVGKTRLALQAASERVRPFKHGVCFVPLGAIGSDDQLYPVLAEALSLSGGGQPQRDSRGRVLDYLRNREILLVLDQFEHLRHQALVLMELLQRAPGAKLIVTSLEPLNLRGEWTLAIGGLGLPASGQPEEILGSDAVRLFLEGAHRVRADCNPLTTDLEFIARICRLVEGIPLGIELASAWTRVLTCREIAEEIERSYSFLVGNSQDLPERHASLRAALDQSWHRLSDVEKGAFRRLCVFRDGFTRDAAEQVADVSLNILVSLIDKNLVHGSPFGRYYVHTLVGQYGLEKLADVPQERQTTYERHCEYYAAFLQRTTGRFLRMWEEDALPEIAAERENLRAAWRWASTSSGPA